MLVRVSPHDHPAAPPRGFRTQKLDIAFRQHPRAAVGQPCDGRAVAHFWWGGQHGRRGRNETAGADERPHPDSAGTPPPPSRTLCAVLTERAPCGFVAAANVRTQACKHPEAGAPWRRAPPGAVRARNPARATTLGAASRWPCRPRSRHSLVPPRAARVAHLAVRHDLLGMPSSSRMCGVYGYTRRIRTIYASHELRDQLNLPLKEEWSEWCLSGARL
jgi:hypothetical protein